MEAAAVGFPGARTAVRVRSQQDETSDWEERHYISSHRHDAHSPAEWMDMVRKHWAVENKNHWRKDATLGEDATRSRNPNVVSNLALLGQLVLFVFERQKHFHPNLKAWTEHNHAKEATLLSLMMRRLAT